MRHQWHRHDIPKCADQLEIERDAPLCHGMRCPNGDTERVHTRCLHEGPCLVRFRANPGCMDTILAADLAELGFDVEPAIVTLPHNGCSGGDVVLVRHRGCVKHHRAKTQRDGFLDQCLSVAWSR